MERQQVNQGIEDTAAKKTLTTEVNQPKLQVWTEDVTVQRTKVIKRLTFRNMGVEIADAFNLDKGLIYTLKGLTIRPSQTIRAYLDTGRDLVTNPMKYFLLVVGSVLVLASQNGYFDYNNQFEDGIEAGMKMNGANEAEISEGKQEMITAILEAYNDYFVSYQNVWFIVTILFTSFFTYLFFKKRGYNFIEHNVINAYIFVHTYLIFGLIVLFKLDMGVWFYPYFGAYLMMSLVVYKQLFQISWWTTIWKTVLAFTASLIVFYILIVIAAAVIAIQTIKG